MLLHPLLSFHKLVDGLAQIVDGIQIPGGHREAGETPLDTARRELYEETGAVRAEFTPVCVYGVKRDSGTRYGMLYFAVITELGGIPADSEIAEIRLTDALPQNLTYPAIQPHLYREVQGFLNRRTAANGNITYQDLSYHNTLTL